MELHTEREIRKEHSREHTETKYIWMNVAGMYILHTQYKQIHTVSNIDSASWAKHCHRSIP